MARRGPRFATQRLILMVKAPRVGAAKTRLARDIGATAATRFYRSVSANLIRRLGNDPRWRLVLAVAPDRETASGAWPRELPRIGQGGGDIGARMLRLLMGANAERAILIGSDIPGVRAEHIAQGFAALARHDMVFGPAADGGFWLIGFKRGRAPAGLFEGVRWSSRHALADTLENIAGRKVALAQTLSDVDDAEAYRSVAHLGGRVTLGNSLPLPRM